MHFPTLYLIPCPIFEGKNDSIPKETNDFLHSLRYFIVENPKPARHYIKRAGHPTPIATLHILSIDSSEKEILDFLGQLPEGESVGLISDAGCPCIADPGAKVVNIAYKLKFIVKPLIGPSSIILALMASGFNGQNFAFNGYLPNKKPQVNKELKELETKLYKTGQTQIFMETPYRNIFLLENCIESLGPKTELVIACDLNTEKEDIQKYSIQQWKQIDSSYLHKRPSIFVIGINNN